MGTLTMFLQQEFASKCPTGWRCHAERTLLPAPLAQLLGYQARADVLLEKQDGTRRLWIEFEVSRADPVANHAKFATSHLFEQQQANDVDLAMVSPQVLPGQRNLAANAIALMRQVGMRASRLAYSRTIPLPRFNGSTISGSRPWPRPAPPWNRKSNGRSS